MLRKKTLTLKKAVYLPMHEVERLSENKKKSILAVLRVVTGFVVLVLAATF